MSAFAIAHHPDHLDRFCRDFATFAAFLDASSSDPAEALLGIWVEHRTLATRVARLMAPDWMATESELPIALSTELSGLWTLYRLSSSMVSRAAVLDALSRLPGQGLGRTKSRFLPVFPDGDARGEWEPEWASLAARHPGLLLPPIMQRADGALRLDDISWVDRRVVQVSQPVQDAAGRV